MSFAPKFTIERLEYTEEMVGEKKKKTFYVNEPDPDGSKLVILSFAKEKVVINNGVLDEDKITISKKPMPFKFKTLFLKSPSNLTLFKRKSDASRVKIFPLIFLISKSS